MDTLANTMREWLSMQFENGNRLVRLLHILCFILENVLDSFSGRHWAFLCSTIHAAFSGHFEPLSNFFVDHPPSSIFLFACSLDLFALDQFIEDLSFVNCLIRELISFHHFKGIQTTKPPQFCCFCCCRLSFYSVAFQIHAVISRITRTCSWRIQCQSRTSTVFASSQSYHWAWPFWPNVRRQ